MKWKPIAFNDIFLAVRSLMNLRYKKRYNFIRVTLGVTWTHLYIYIYIDVKTNKDEYVKSIIYIYIYCKKNEINNK